MSKMNVSQPLQIGCGGEDITTNTTGTMIEMKQERSYKRKNCGGDTTNTPTVMKKSKVSGATNTPTVTETKKRPYKRKNCGDANTSAIMDIKKKRPYKRKNCGDENTSTLMETKKKKDCGGDTADTSTVMKKSKDCGGTNTPTVMETKNRPYERKHCGDANTSTAMEACRRKDCGGDTTNTSTVMETKKKRAYRRKKCLPHDLIVDEILTRLPVQTLLTSVLVSKLWYNSIHNDHKRLTYYHFLESQKHPQVILSLLNVRNGVNKNTGEPEYGCHFFKFNTRIYGTENIVKFDKFRGCVFDRGVYEMVGYRHGLPCVAAVGKYSTGYMIVDPNRKDFLSIFHPVKVGKCTTNARTICHGFGFDSSTNKYKLVSFFSTAEKVLNAVVFTLGTKSWRDVTATIVPILGRPIRHLRVRTGRDKSAIFCTTSSNGCLVWKIIANLVEARSDNIEHDYSNMDGNELEMLLSFNLHDDKYQFIQLPAKRTTGEQQKHPLAVFPRLLELKGFPCKHLHDDYPHLLEFKGSPCIARFEKLPTKGSDDSHRSRDDHPSRTRCCCCSKVHLCLLKEEGWVQEESFDVCVDSNLTWSRDLAPDPCCFCFDAIPPTRIFSFSDQMFLYWFNGKHLQVYNLRSKKLQLVLPVHPKEADVFGAKRIEPQHIYYCSDVFSWLDDDISFINQDFQLHCHEDNFVSLQTFIPEGVEGVDVDGFSESDLDRCSAYVLIHRGSKVYYPSY
ncbi:uncharacterized protein LOC113329374 [Papaver somniferum]|uniref:uncharacterized protein LOC113329374 n=1 Tax=Papaver somniferum TaxID=3469 RepID=UPI000E6FE224|nr:uncharacterized protein LOC113329374 [Papaver somniferum]